MNCFASDEDSLLFIEAALHFLLTAKVEIAMLFTFLCDVVPDYYGWFDVVSATREQILQITAIETICGQVSD